ncbi:hypothetical protein HOY82DRAFT_544327 [Tuber indicum]|nr:hypothetical protein HOY82DRAFT_544327 [Tuber indicum]
MAGDLQSLKLLLKLTTRASSSSSRDSEAIDDLEPEVETNHSDSAILGGIGPNRIPGWPELTGIEQTFQDMEIDQDQFILDNYSKEENDIDDFSDLYTEENKENEDLGAKRSTEWPKLSRLEQILHDFEIWNDSIENTEEDSEDEQDKKRRKGKNVLRLSRISDLGYDKLPNLMIEERNQGDIDSPENMKVFSDRLLNTGTIYLGMICSIYNNQST